MIALKIGRRLTISAYWRSWCWFFWLDEAEMLSVQIGCVCLEYEHGHDSEPLPQFEAIAVKLAAEGC